MCSRSTSGYIEPAPNNPKPPALLTAEAKRQPLAQTIPAWMMGYWMPSSLQIGFSIKETGKLQKIDEIERLPLSCLEGIEQQKQQLLENSRAFAKGLRANNALLWGARGTGKSSLLKAVHGALLSEGLDCAIVEVQR